MTFKGIKKKGEKEHLHGEPHYEDEEGEEGAGNVIRNPRSPILVQQLLPTSLSHLLILPLSYPNLLLLPGGGGGGGGGKHGGSGGVGGAHGALHCSGPRCPPTQDSLLAYL